LYVPLSEKSEGNRHSFERESGDTTCQRKKEPVVFLGQQETRLSLHAFLHRRCLQDKMQRGQKKKDKGSALGKKSPPTKEIATVSARGEKRNGTVGGGGRVGCTTEIQPGEKNRGKKKGSGAIVFITSGNAGNSKRKGGKPRLENYPDRLKKNRWGWKRAGARHQKKKAGKKNSPGGLGVAKIVSMGRHTVDRGSQLP